MRTRSYSEKQLRKAVKESISYRQVILKLGLKTAGGNYQSIKSLVKRLAIDVSHFKGKGWNKGQVHGPKRDTSYYLTDNCKHEIKTSWLRCRLISDGYFEHKCYNCGLSEWQHQPIPLQLHHIDGNNRNNNIDNLTVLCPNCHALTISYCRPK